MQLSDYIEVVEINKGWSGDKKYCVTDKDGHKYLLRLSSAEQYERKKTEFENMQRVWQLLALYVCTNTLSSLPWAISFGQEQIDIMIEQAEDVLGWYEDMKNPVPGWYVKM